MWWPGRHALPDLPLVRNKKYGKRDAAETGGVIPFQRLDQIGDGENRKDRKDRKDRQGDDFLNGFLLRGGKFIGADAIRGNLEAVLEKGDAPTDHHDLPEGDATILEMAVPCKGHEDVGNGEKNDCAHGRESLLEILDEFDEF